MKYKLFDQIHAASEDYRLGQFEYPEWERTATGCRFDRMKTAMLIELGVAQMEELVDLAEHDEQVSDFLNAGRIYGLTIRPINVPSWLMAF